MIEGDVSFIFLVQSGHIGYDNRPAQHTTECEDFGFLVVDGDNDPVIKHPYCYTQLLGFCQTLVSPFPPFPIPTPVVRVPHIDTIGGKQNRC